jgi:hypothetical protein
MIVEKSLEKKNVSLESPETSALIGFSLRSFKLEIQGLSSQKTDYKA